MYSIVDMIKSHPNRSADLDFDAVAACIEACNECEFACNACADACLAEDNVKNLLHCIRLNQDCVDACTSASRILGRQTQPDVGLLVAQVEAMVLACRLCAEECERHSSQHGHCRICAEVCRRCEQACHRVLQSVSAPTT